MELLLKQPKYALVRPKDQIAIYAPRDARMSINGQANRWL